MELTVNRKPPDGIAVPGDLYVNGTFECLTLENGSVMIATGRYSIVLYNSPHAGHIVPLLQNVPGRDSVECHCGNLPADSKGCILVGQSYTEGTILRSHLAFDHLFPQIQKAIEAGEEVWITIA